MGFGSLGCSPSEICRKLGVSVRTLWKPNTQEVEKAAKKANIDSIAAAARYTRGVAMRMIAINPKPSLPGKPPHSRTGRLKKSIVYKVEYQGASAVIGPARSALALIGRTHEFSGDEPPKKIRRGNMVLKIGGQGPIRTRGHMPVFVKLNTASQVRRATELAKLIYPKDATFSMSKKRHYPARPFMGPSLRIAAQRLPEHWANSVRGR